MCEVKKCQFCAKSAINAGSLLSREELASWAKRIEDADPYVMQDGRINPAAQPRGDWSPVCEDHVDFKNIQQTSVVQEYVDNNPEGPFTDAALRDWLGMPPPKH